VSSMAAAACDGSSGCTTSKTPCGNAREGRDDEDERVQGHGGAPALSPISQPKSCPYHTTAPCRQERRARHGGHPARGDPINSRWYSLRAWRLPGGRRGRHGDYSNNERVGHDLCAATTPRRGTAVKVPRTALLGHSLITIRTPATAKADAGAAKPMRARDCRVEPCDSPALPPLSHGLSDPVGRRVACAKSPMIVSHE